MKLFFHGDEEQHHPERSWAFRVLRRIIPLDPPHRGARVLPAEQGGCVATPLFLALALIEISDVVFALDSIPAIFGVTLDPFIVFTSNIFAILGLRSLYFAVAQLLEPLRVPLRRARRGARRSSARRCSCRAGST